MRKLAVVLCLFITSASIAQTNNDKDPTWWDKYQFILNNGPIAAAGTTTSVANGGNVDVSNECGPQSETYITLNTANPLNLAAGSNEIFRLPMRIRLRLSATTCTSRGMPPLAVPRPVESAWRHRRTMARLSP